MDLSIIADAFVVTVVGGLGSIPGAFLAAALIGVTKAFCIALGDVDVFGVTFAFPKLTLVVEFVIMAIVLSLKPQGLLGKPPPVPVTTALPEQRALVVAPTRHAALIAGSSCLAWPFCLRARRIQCGADDRHRDRGAVRGKPALLLATGGMTSFGHAAYFGVGAYAARSRCVPDCRCSRPSRSRRLPPESRQSCSAGSACAWPRLHGDADAGIRADRLVHRVSMKA
jgi:branched-chain amino acid transport system permease protein